MLARETDFFLFSFSFLFKKGEGDLGFGEWQSVRYNEEKVTSFGLSTVF